jgi:hypothetical protein
LASFLKAPTAKATLREAELRYALGTEYHWSLFKHPQAISELSQAMALFTTHKEFVRGARAAQRVAWLFQRTGQRDRAIQVAQVAERASRGQVGYPRRLSLSLLRDLHHPVDPDLALLYSILHLQSDAEAKKQNLAQRREDVLGGESYGLVQGCRISYIIIPYEATLNSAFYRERSSYYTVLRVEDGRIISAVFERTDPPDRAEWVSVMAAIHRRNATTKCESMGSNIVVDNPSYGRDENSYRIAQDTALNRAQRIEQLLNNRSESTELELADLVLDQRLLDYGDRRITVKFPGNPTDFAFNVYLSRKQEKKLLRVIQSIVEHVNGNIGNLFSEVSYKLEGRVVVVRDEFLNLRKNTETKIQQFFEIASLASKIEVRRASIGMYPEKDGVVAAKYAAEISQLEAQFVAQMIREKKLDVKPEAEWLAPVK